MAALDGLMIVGRETGHQAKTRSPRSYRGAMDWDDVRVFLAVAREGSMRAAGRALGLSQPNRPPIGCVRVHFWRGEPV